ncbi:hypothetical protein TrVE_jg48 [Triparma verrucosa]|uniref:SRCR domain-containing protein n=1 Tax=Triparma verrucosa TaxID=1606542 RepID=A0A9W7FMW6_9STRA|nr:hypothetical protein TrVE_jg48 [Triparma verrucosa]
MGSSSSTPSKGCTTPCPSTATYVNVKCKWWKWWCSPKVRMKVRVRSGDVLRTAPNQLLTPLFSGGLRSKGITFSLFFRNPSANEDHKHHVPISCAAGGCEGRVEYLDGCDASGCTGNICGAGWELASDVEAICGKESGFATAGRQCDPGKGFFQRATCRQTTGGSKVFAVYSHNLDSGTCWVSMANEYTVYAPYIWDGCPDFSSSDSDWNIRYGLYTSDKTETQQRPTDGSAGKSGFTEASTLPLIGKSHTVEGVGAIGGIGAAAVLGFGFMRGKKRQAKKKTATQDLEMSGGNAV